MDLSPIKREVLEALLLQDQPAKATLVARESGKDPKVVQMHLIGLTRMGCASAPEKGTYAITEQGKQALGLPEVSREKALSLLRQTPHEKAFHFYAGIDKSLNVYAHDLAEFCDLLGKVGSESLEFHVARGDFEAWFTALGDAELVKKTALLKERNLKGEELCSKLSKLVANRFSELSAKAGKAP